MIDRIKLSAISDRASAAEALGEIGDEKAVEALIVVLKDVDSEFRKFADEAINKIKERQKILFESYPNIICTKDFFRAEKKRIGLFKKYVLCQVCRSSAYLVQNIKQVIGLIGGDIKDHKIDEDKIYMNLWDEDTKIARVADIDILVINNDKIDSDRAINDVCVKIRNIPKKNKKIDIILKDNPPLSENFKRQLSIFGIIIKNTS